MNHLRVSGRFMRRSILVAVVSALVTGCVVYDQVSVYPIVLRISESQTNRRLTSVVQLVENNEYGDALKMGWTVAQHPHASARELAALGRAEMVGGRFEQANIHLRKALEEDPPRQIAAEANWDLSQVAYLQDDYANALALAKEAVRYGLPVQKWDLDLLQALSSRSTPPEVTPVDSGYLPMRFGRPDIPRFTVMVNGDKPVEAIIDSGAVFTIVSESFAKTARVKPLGDVGGDLIGLLGEPIRVRYGIIDSIAIGPVVVRNVPVAIMPDDKLSFVSVQKRPFHMSVLLGTNLLKNFRIEIDVARKRVRFTPVELTHDTPRRDQNLFYMGLRPMIEAAIDRHGWYLFLLDTGSEITFLNFATLNQTSLGRWSKIHGATLQGLGGAMKHGSRLQNVELSTGGWAGKFSTIALYSTDTPAFGIIGQNFLSKFRVIIDFGKMRIDFLEGQ